jgi:L-ascorbate metabolism protein UlaG (beta-lactamase superfamily)
LVLTKFTYAPARFDGRRFVNLSGEPAGRSQDAFKWFLTRERVAWPAHVDNPPPSPTVSRVDDGTIHATLIGHSTVLLQLAGLNILTDPMFSDCAGPFSWLGIKRSRVPALAFDALPQIDVVLLSHNHYDHLDRPTLKALIRRDKPLVVTGLRVGKSVPTRDIVECDWWQSHRLTDRVTATYVPSEHFSARGPFDRNTTLWGGFVLETPLGRIYFAGDTGNGAHFAMIRERFGPMTLSFIPIGAYEPRWFMSAVHIDPAEAVAASCTLESEISLAIHFETFHLADEGFSDPADALKAALKDIRHVGRGADFRLPVFGRRMVLTPSR